MDNTARLWDITGRHIQTFRGHTKGVRAAYFAPDGRNVITAAEDGTARVWRLAADIYSELRSATDIYQLTPDDLEEYGLDLSICAPCI